MNALEIRYLSKSFPGFQLGPLSLTLPEGCILGLVGENGAGKSTTIRALLGMLRRDGGSITLLGREDGAETASLREETGVVLDEVGLPECLTARQVGKVMSGVYRSWSGESFEKYLESLDIPLGKPFKELSRGNRMKLGIAVALSHAPRLLIFDEATNGLDPVARDQVTELLLDFTREPGHSVLLSSHIVSDLERICDYIAFLHKGRLLLCEEKDALLEEYGLLRCAPETLAELPAGAVLHKKESAWGVEALVRRDAVPAGLELGGVSLEELFVHMVKEA